MAATSRLLAFYRIVVVLLVAGVAVGLTVRRWGRRWPRPPVVVRDLGAELATLAAEAPRIVDRSETYYHSSRASVHVHVMGYGQRCPLHLHAETHEATVVVSGEAQVVQLSGAGTGLARTAATYPEGWLIASPPRCAHEFVNPSPRALLANLVFAAPPFGGNQYVAADDPRPRTAPAPYVWSAGAALADLAARGASSRLAELPVLGGRLASLLVRTEAALPAEADGPQLVYVVAGQGELAARGAHRLAPHTLVTLRAGLAATVRAAPGSPLAALVFRPER